MAAKDATGVELVNEEVTEQNYEILDRQLRRWAGIKSARQIAELTGYSPDEVIRRRNFLVDAIDELTVAQQMSFILSELQDTARTYREKADQISPNDPDSGRNIGPIITASIQAQKAAMTQLNTISKASQGTVDTLNQKRYEELIALIKETIYTSIAIVAERFDLEEADLIEIFQARLVAAADRRGVEA